MKLKIDRVRYHRNGCMGAGFDLVEFRYRLQGERRERRLVAAVFEEAGNCAVIEPANLLNKWRGDDFEPALRAAIATAHRENKDVFSRDGADN